MITQRAVGADGELAVRAGRASQRDDAGDLLAQRRLQLRRIVELAALHALPRRLEERGGGLHADVGGEEDLLHLGQRRLVHLARAAEDPLEPGHEAAAGLLEPGRQRASGLGLGASPLLLLLAEAGLLGLAREPRLLLPGDAARPPPAPAGAAPSRAARPPSSAGTPPSCGPPRRPRTASRRATCGGGRGRGRGPGARAGARGRERRLGDRAPTPASRSSSRSISACGTGGSTGAAPRFRNMRRPATTKSATSAATTAAPTRSEVAKASGMGSTWTLRKEGKMPRKRDHIGPGPARCQRAAEGGEAVTVVRIRDRGPNP